MKNGGFNCLHALYISGTTARWHSLKIMLCDWIDVTICVESIVVGVSFCISDELECFVLDCQ